MTDRAWAEALVKKLTELAGPDNSNRGPLAHLRRGLQAPLDYTLARVGWLFQPVPNWALENAALAAGLFAWVKGDCPQAEKVSFGGAFGAGLTLEEAAECLGLSQRTAYRHWAYARAWLRRELDRSDEDGARE